MTAQVALIYAVGFAIGMGLWWLIGRWVRYQIRGLHPVTKFIIWGLLALTVAVLASSEAPERAARAAHVWLNFDGRH